MTGVVFPSMEAYGNMAKAVAAVNRGGMEHPFHRRQLPVGTGTYLGLAQYGTDNDLYLGPMDQTGVQIEGTGTMLGTPGQTSPEPDRDIDATYLRSVVAPGDFFWGVDTGETIYAVCGGTTFLVGDVDDDLTILTHYTNIRVAYGPFCGGTQGDNYVMGQQLGIMFTWTYPNGGGFVVITNCCPPG